MVNNFETVRILRHALLYSPDNLPLRQHLAEVLLSVGQAEEAEKEYRFALSQAPEHPDVRYGLARSLYEQGKIADALAGIEELIKQPVFPACTYILYARLLLSFGEIELAKQQYKLGIQSNIETQDAELEMLLRSNSVNEYKKVNYSESQSISFKDIVGMEAVKEEICLRTIYPKHHPQIYRAYGKSCSGSILMYGPPGCGKTYLALACAAQIQGKFIAVRDWMKNSQPRYSDRDLRQLFVKARQKSPCVVFFDEVDSLIASNGDRAVVHQFLLELDSLKRCDRQILVLAATNVPWYIDPAFRIAGRFDRIVFVPPPDVMQRAEILKLLCQGKAVEDIDCNAIARRTGLFSGGDLKMLVDRVTDRKLLQAMKTGITEPISTSDLLDCAETIKPVTKEWFATASNYALYARGNDFYDDLREYLESNSLP